jgi:hypothetical protein
MNGRAENFISVKYNEFLVGKILLHFKHSGPFIYSLIHVFIHLFK